MKYCSNEIPINQGLGINWLKKSDEFRNFVWLKLRFTKFVLMYVYIVQKITISTTQTFQAESIGLGDSGTRWKNSKKIFSQHYLDFALKNLKVANVWKLSLKKAEMAVCFFIFLIDSAPNLKLRLKILKKQGCNYSKLIKRGCKNCSLDTENPFCW